MGQESVLPAMALRLTAKTPAFDAGNPGSNPGGPTQSESVSISGSTRIGAGPVSGVTSA